MIISRPTTAQSNRNENVKIYPNPVQSELIISGIAVVNSLVAIYNSLGTKLFENRANGSQTVFDVSSLHKGLYFVRFSDGFSLKFLKQ